MTMKESDQQNHTSHASNPTNVTRKRTLSTDSWLMKQQQQQPQRSRGSSFFNSFQRNSSSNNSFRIQKEKQRRFSYAVAQQQQEGYNNGNNNSHDPQHERYKHRCYYSTDRIRESELHHSADDSNMMYNNGDVLLNEDEIFWQLLEQEEDVIMMTQAQPTTSHTNRQRSNTGNSITAAASAAMTTTTGVRDRTASKQSVGSNNTNNKGIRRVGQQLPLSSSSSSLRILGPSITSIEYMTMTPPPSWSKAASRNLIVTDKVWDLKRIVSFHLLPTMNDNLKNTTKTNNTKNNNAFADVGNATLMIQKMKNNTTTAAVGVYQQPSHTSPTNTNRDNNKIVIHQSVVDYSIYIHTPPESGVLDIYIKNNNNNNKSSNSNTHNESYEQTFTSAAAAAQFQMDLLTLQIIGPAIQNLYYAFRMIHKGSIVYNGTESVLHHQQYHNNNNNNETKSLGGIGKNDGNVADNSSTKRDTGSTIATKNNDTNGAMNQTTELHYTTDECGIAWDDVMRCLGCSFPSIRLRLEAMRWLEVYSHLEVPHTTTKQQRGNKNSNKSGMSTTVQGSSSSIGNNMNTKLGEQGGYKRLDTLYRNRRRLLLGPVDFFRLFVPKLPETAIPEDECSRKRMELLLRIRKRVARASILVQSYTRAKMVVNLGWNVQQKSSQYQQLPDAYWKRRYAFDDDIDNHHHDGMASNEYYEGTVSRDVDCQVRGMDYWKKIDRKKRNKLNLVTTATSLYQAYSLVGIHSFEWEIGDHNCPLHYKKDPVQSIKSLQNLIHSHPELDFFVVTIFLPTQETAIVHVYVRSLPKGVDPKFDYSMNRFIDGDENIRKKKLEVMLQLEIDKNGLSFLEKCILWWLLFLLRLTVRRRLQASNISATNDRTSFPPLNLSDCGETFHFGGSLNTNDTSSRNYVSMTANLASSRNCNLITRMMLSYIELGGLSRNIADVTFILAGENENELPERALCTSRTVRATLTKLPIKLVSQTDDVSPIDLATTFSKEDKGITSLMLKLFIVDPTVTAIETVIRSVVDFQQLPSVFSPKKASRQLVKQYEKKVEKAVIDGSATDPFEKAINKIISILEGIYIPVKPIVNSTDNTEVLDVDVMGPALAITKYEQVPILETLRREDVIRYFIATNCNPQTAVVRIVESAIWRGTTFPVDIRRSRIELQTGQFFHQGFDLLGNPVFYFRNMCLGPWRKDEDAVISAVLHRLENTLKIASSTNPHVKCTLIIMAGKPYSPKHDPQSFNSKDASNGDKDDKLDQSTIASTAVSTLTGTADDTMISNDANSEGVEEGNSNIADIYKTPLSNNPRMFTDENWSVHSSKTLIEKLIYILMNHYPERLGQALIVVGHGNKKYARTAIGGLLYMTSLVPSTRTRDKVRFLMRYRDLQSYVHRSQLVTIVGGTQIVDDRHYECI